jgi:broad specificity phosphatase PhoE
VLVHLIRHGQSFNTHRAPGEPSPANPRLTPIGVQQAERLAARLGKLQIDRLVASPMLRAVETADHVATATGKPVEVLSNCYEHRPGEGYQCWGAMRLLEQYPKLLVPEDLHPEEWTYGGEALEAAVERAGTFAEWLRAQATAGDSRLAVVTHATITRLLLERLLDLPPRALHALILHNTAVTTLRFNPTADAERPLELLAVNDTTHLAGAPALDPLAGLAR